MNEIQVTIRGNITTELRQIRFDDGNLLTSFRMASNARRYDSQNREWVNAGTTFVNVNCRRAMASNVANSFMKGQPVIVTGKLRERTWEKDGRTGRSLEIEADGVGHDLAWGTSDFARVVRTEQVRPESEQRLGEVAAELVDETDRDQLGAAGHLDEDDEFPGIDNELDDLDDAELRERRLSTTA